MREIEAKDAVGDLRIPGTETSAANAFVAPWADAKVAAILGPAAIPGAQGAGRLMFAMDATASRSATWAAALQVQASMFSAVAGASGLKVQLVYFRGVEFKASRWAEKPEELADAMCGVECQAGATQIDKVLRHAVATADRQGLAALVYVGDCMEERQKVLLSIACQLAARGIKAFVFQEGSCGTAERAFREIAGVTKGAYCRLGEGSAAELKGLLSAVAAYASGGTAALAVLGRREAGAQLLLSQLK